MNTNLYVRSGDDFRLASGAEILETAATIKARNFESARTTIDSPEVARTFLIDQLQHCEHEYFCVLYLDTRHGVIAFERMFRGTVDGSAVHPREVVKAALARNAAAVILAHNHPSGVAEPSRADEAITQRLREGLDLVEIRVLDHLIIGNGCFSFLEHGLI